MQQEKPNACKWDVSVIAYVFSKGKKYPHGKQTKKQFIFSDAKKHWTKGREIPFNIHIHLFIDSFKKYYQTPAICQAKAIPSGCGGQQRWQGLVFRYQKIKQEAKEGSAIFVGFFFFFNLFFFPSWGFSSSEILDMTYPGHISEVKKPLLDIYLQFPTIYWVDKHFAVL